MIDFLQKKFPLLTTEILIWQFIILPIKSFALEYNALEPEAFKEFNKSGDTKLAQFLSQAFSFGLAIAAALSVIMIVWGGVQIMTTDSWTGKSSGKQKIWDAIWGLLLALVSWLILYTINPDILKFKL
jgi:hypothetical protein